MKITKLGHCCLVLETGGVKLLTDPGNFSETQNSITGLDAVLITHEHQDHLHVESLKQVLANNPTAMVIGNSAVAKIIGEAIADTQVVVVGDGQSTMVKDIKVEGFGKDHALVYPPNLGLVENTGYFVEFYDLAKREKEESDSSFRASDGHIKTKSFYFPGDNFYNPNKKVDVLALPVAGPWMKIADAVDFAKLLKARTAFGVHDGMIQPFFRGYIGMLLERFVPETKYVSLQDGETREF